MLKKHLEDHGVSYFQHLKLAFFFAKECFKASLMAFFHGVFPFFFKTGASDIHKLILPRYEVMLKRYKSDYAKSISK